MTIRMQAAAAVAALGMLTPASASAASRPPENPVCVPLSATITHWEHVLRHPTPARYYAAAIAVLDYIGPATPHLNRWVTEIGNSWYADSIGWDFHAQTAEGLRHITRLCPGAHPHPGTVPGQ